jgi:hypothetical protein
VENILYDDDRATGRFSYGTLTAVGSQLGIFVFLGVAKLRHTDADAELLTTFVTLEH